MRQRFYTDFNHKTEDVMKKKRAVNNQWKNGIILFVLLPFLVNQAYGGPSIQEKIRAICGSLTSEVPEIANKAVAVFPFKQGEVYTDKGKALAEMFIANLREAGITIVDKSEYTKAIKEIAFSQTGATEKELEMGKMLAAEYFIKGPILSHMGSEFLNVKVIEVESQKLLYTHKLLLDNSDIESINHFLLQEERKVSSYILRSTVIPGWGQIFAGKNARGIISPILVAGGAGLSIYKWVNTDKKSSDWDKLDNLADYNNSTKDKWARDNGFDSWNSDAIEFYKQELADCEDDYNHARKRAILFTSITGGLWFLNIIDAAIAGHQKKSSLNKYFSFDVRIFGDKKMITMNFLF